MAFNPDDGEAFAATRDSLLARFEEWLGADGRVARDDAAGMAADAGVALDWKWGYGDGDLGSWGTPHVAEFLLDWCPRKLSGPAADAAQIPASLAALAAFLDDQGLLGAGSSPAAELVRVARSLTDEFVAAMSDPAKFGLAKSLVLAASADGVDLSDPERVQGWIADFNARPEQERRRLIPDAGPPRRPALPPVAVPDDREARASKAQAPVLRMLAGLAEFAAEGRKLTQTGNLTLADARVLVERLGTGDVMDPQIGQRTFKTRSSAELPRLRHVFAWARKAGVVRIVRGRVVATKAGLAISRDPARFFDRAVDALLAIGPVSSQRDPHGWLAWPEVNELLDRFVVHLLAGPYVAQRPVPLDDLAAVATSAVLDVFRFPTLDDDRVARLIAGDVIDIVDVLELAGVLRRLHVADPPDQELGYRRRRQGGAVELTAAGVATARRLLMAQGYDVPSAGRFSDATGAELLSGTNLDDFAVLWAEIEAWRRRRQPADAARQLADAVRVLADPALRNLALAVMSDMDPEIAAPEVRKLAAEPDARGLALCWLVDHGLEEPQALFDPDDVAWFVDVLAQRLVVGGPEGLCDTLALAGSHDRQIHLLGQLWRSPSTATDAVLAAIGELHPTKIVAKAARKARFQRRSWVGA